MLTEANGLWFPQGSFPSNPGHPERNRVGQSTRTFGFFPSRPLTAATWAQAVPSFLPGLAYTAKADFPDRFCEAFFLHTFCNSHFKGCQNQPEAAGRWHLLSTYDDSGAGLSTSCRASAVCTYGGKGKRKVERTPSEV